MGVEEDEQVDRAIAAILAVVALELARRGRDRLANLADQLGRALVEAHHRSRPELGVFFLAQFDPVPYIHSDLLEGETRRIQR